MLSSGCLRSATPVSQSEGFVARNYPAQIGDPREASQSRSALQQTEDCASEHK